MRPNEKVASAKSTWDTMDVQKSRSVAWLSIPEVASYISMRFSSPHGAVATVHNHLQKRGFSAGLNGVALVCGDMESERLFFQSSQHISFASVEGFDLSDISLQRVRPSTYEFTPNVVDCNQLQLQPGAYHLAIASHGAHHIENLDNFFGQIRASLKERGLIYIYEWIGPQYLQIPISNRVISKLLVIMLFPLKTTRTTHMGKVRGIRYLQDSPESFDPSEACNSDELYPMFTKHFLPIEQFMHGGLTYPILEGIAQNMNLESISTRRRLRFLIKVEEILTKLKIIKPLFIWSIAEQRPTKSEGT